MRSPLTWTAACAIALGIAPHAARAQQTANTVVGRFVDDAGAPIPGVRVSIGSTSFSAVSDSAGRFRLSGVAAGPAEFVVRRIGYEPTEFSATLRVGASRVPDMTLKAIVIELRG